MGSSNNAAQQNQAAQQQIQQNTQQAQNSLDSFMGAHPPPNPNANSYTAIPTPQNISATSAAPGLEDIAKLISQWTGAAQSNGPTRVTPSTATASSANAGLVAPDILAGLSPNATVDQLLKGVQPSEMQGQRALNQQFSNQGITGGQAVAATGDLQGNFQAQIAPAIASAIQNAQANTLQGSEFNAGQTQANNQFNAGQQTGVSEFNAGQEQSANATSVANALQQAMANAGLQSTNINDLNAAIAAATGQNAANTNSTNQFNANESNAVNLANMNVNNQTSAANAAGNNQWNTQILQALMQEWQTQLQAQMGVTGAGQQAGNQQGLNYGQDITVSDPWATIFGGLTGAAGAASGLGLGVGSGQAQAPATRPDYGGAILA